MLSIRFLKTVLILALDTTTRAGSVAVTRDNHLLSLVHGDGTRTHGERLPNEIAEALARAGVTQDAVDLFAVATGPGGFTGLRIGLAAIQGMAMALNRPVAGVSTFTALTEQVTDTTPACIVPWMDAQRGDVFATIVELPVRAEIVRRVAENPAAVLNQFRTRIAGRSALFIGDAVTRDAAMIQAAGDGRWLTQVPRALAPEIAGIAARMASRGQTGPPHTLEPIYVRRSDAEIDRDRRQPQVDEPQ